MDIKYGSAHRRNQRGLCVNTFSKIKLLFASHMQANLYYKLYTWFIILRLQIVQDELESVVVERDVGDTLLWPIFHLTGVSD